MQSSSNIFGYIVSAVSMLLMGAGFIMLVRTIKKSNRMRSGSLVLSMIFSIAMLVFNLVVMKSARVRWWFALLMAFGAGFGFAWGRTTKLRFEEQKILGQRSVLYIYFWLASMLMTQVLAFFAKTNVVAYGLAGMFFSTGASLGTNGNLLYRMVRLLRSPQPAIVQDVSTPDETDAGGYCTHCGAMLVANADFCSQCGQKNAIPKRALKRKRGWIAGVSVAGVVVIGISGFLLLRSLINQPEIAPEVIPVEGVEINNSTLVAQVKATFDAIPADTLQPQVTQTKAVTAKAENVPIAQSGEYISVSFDATSAAMMIPAFSENVMSYFTAEGLGVIESVGTGIVSIENKMGDFSAFFDFMMPEAYQKSACGFIFRAEKNIIDGKEGEMYALFLYPGENELHMGIWLDGGWVFSEALAPEPAMNTGYEMNSVQLEVEGDSTKIYVNENFVGNFTEGSLMEAGYVGLFLLPSKNVPDDGFEYVLFDDLMVVEK